VLAWLAIEAADLSQAELADRMNIEPQTLVSVLDRMERDGLVARVACAEDRRKKRVRALSKASEVWASIMACGARVREAAFRGLSPAETETLQTLLQRVRENLSRAAESR
jgi:MarR family transcriptional regulator for hemolysin